MILKVNGKINEFFKFDTDLYENVVLITIRLNRKTGEIEIYLNNEMVGKTI